MADDRMPSPDILRALLRYEPETGKLFWRERGVEWFQNETEGGRDPEWRMKGWNKKWAGKEALAHMSPICGYRKGAVLNIPLCAHRVAFSIYHNRKLVGEIDHINGVRTDNRAVNLREVDHTGNARNVALYSSNKSGTPGVRWEEDHKAWSVKINYNGKQRRVGRFKRKEDAIAARKHAEMVHGYHKNHGRQAIGG